MTDRQEWWALAKADLSCAKFNLSYNFASHAAFLAQQAAEKSLKALLIARA